jgi:multidrug resistance efflux pump
MTQGLGSRRLWALVGLVALLAYAGWIGAPYLRSVVVRDAAVTTWIDTATAPIKGFVDDDPPHAGDSVGRDGVLTLIENPFADRTPVAKAEGEVDRAKERLRGLKELASSLDADPSSRARTAVELADAEVEVKTAETILASAKGAYENERLQPVKAPPESYIWSLIASPGAFVRAGAPIASFVNCGFMLVDVPVSDVELSLLETDSPARVVIEGDRTVRTGKVYLTRGAAATVGADDLAALAKGRYPGVGQVLVKLEPTAAEIEACPIGAAAYVDFPEIGFFDMLRARLRF